MWFELRLRIEPWRFTQHVIIDQGFRMSNAEDQKHFLPLDGMPLEYFARNVFGDRYHGSAGWSKISVWKKLYVDCLLLIRNSFDDSVGSVDAFHRGHIIQTIDRISERIKRSKRKDDVHKWLIIGLFQLVFLLLGNLPKRMASRKKRQPKKFNFSAFRTLSYSQTREQLGVLLRSRIEGNPNKFGFSDFFEAQIAFLNWSKEAKKNNAQNTYVDWVVAEFPELYAQIK